MEKQKPKIDQMALLAPNQTKPGNHPGDKPVSIDYFAASRPEGVAASIEANPEHLADLHPEKLVEELIEITGADYEYAKDSGLLDRFFHEDRADGAIIHILIGNQEEKGFGGGHHDASIGRVPDSRAAIVDKDSLSDTSKLGKTTKKNLKRKAEDWAPGRKLVSIHGQLRTELNEKNQERLVASSVFPESMDAFSTLRMITHAFDNSAEAEVHDGIKVVEKNIELPNGDMRLKIIADTETDKIITAYPVPKHSTAVTPDEEQVKAWQEQTNKE